MQKTKQALQRTNWIRVLMMPTRIQEKCILAAKTDEAKRRLVMTAVCAALEDESRLKRKDLMEQIKQPWWWQWKLFVGVGLFAVVLVAVSLLDVLVGR